MKFPHFRQLDTMDCGPTCLRMIAKYYGRNISMDYLRNKTQLGKEGVSLLSLADAAESIGFRAIGVKLSFDELVKYAPLPAIIHWNQYHFVVLIPDASPHKLVIADPASGIITLKKEEFCKCWLSTSENESDKGIALLIEITPSFLKVNSSDSQKQKKNIGLLYLWGFIKQHKYYFLKILLGLILGSILQLFFPFLTQIIVDTGISTNNLSFIQIVLYAQLMLLFSQTLIEFLRSRILLHISTRINLSLLSVFWNKLLKLPIQFFDNRLPGDIVQRVADHQRIESFLSGTSLYTFLSIFNLIIYSVVIIRYNISIFLIYAAGSFLYLFWIQIFFKYRRNLEYRRFTIASRENSATMQLVYGMKEIKLNNAENSFREAWESLQASLYKLNFKNLSLTQYQQIGAFFINQGKNILITFIVAKLVIEGKLTLGVMLAIQYIIGQLNSPIEQLVGFSQQLQDVKISLERINDIHALEDEETPNKEFLRFVSEEQDIRVEDLSFAYPGADSKEVLKNINLIIPRGKTTAIVGVSGSGKTTLIKLLLRFYDGFKGDIYLGTTDFKNVSPAYWRSISGTVMQETFIFSSSIRKNIAMNDENVDNDRLIHACKTANILSFIEGLPLGFNTKLGAGGKELSGGQKQRLAIARAVYKNPRYIFFDEAINNLDANNEKVILENLQLFFRSKTVIVVAHRLSTVKNSDKIIVLENGQIAEEGTHLELTLKKGKYYELVKNQLDLGN